MNVLGDATMTALQSAIDGLWARQQASAANMANAQTPGYTAQQVSFEGALSDALASGTDPQVTPTVTPSTAAAKQDGNNVDVNGEMVSLIQTQLRYQSAVQAMNGQFSLLSSAVDSGWSSS